FQHPPYDLASAAKMAEVIDREKLDILHVHYAMPHAISAILAKDIAKRDVKIVTTLHGTDITVLGYDKVFKKMIAYGIEQSDAVTAVSQQLVEQTKEQLEVKKEIDVIYNFINEKEYERKDREFIKKDYGILPDEKVFIHISNFRKVKRVEDVIQTFAIVEKKKKAKLILVGDGPEIQTAFELVKSLGLTEEVLFLGRQKNISDLLSISDIKLLMSQEESFGLVLLEVMSCEVVPIATNVGGIPEVIKHGETGFTVDLGDVKAAANFALQLINDEELQQSMVQKGLERLQTHFASDEIINQYISLYKRVIYESDENER